VVELRAVRVERGGQTLLEVPALDVRPREVLAVIGPNGAGKSTLLRVLGLLEAPTQGGVTFQGRPVERAQALAIRRRMASVFQDPLLTDATVRENVALGLGFRGVGAAAAAPRVARWLERFGVAALAERRARTLSGGEAQRTALARALVLEPELLLLDEPFAALDAPTREGLIADLASVLRAEHTTTVLVTHDRDEARSLADRIAVLMDGRLRQLGPASHVFRAPVSEDVARFVGVETILAGRVLDGAVAHAVVEVVGQAVDVEQAAAPGEMVRLCLRPEDVTVKVGPPPPGAGQSRNRLPGRVVRVTPAGSHLRVVMDCGAPVTALVSRQVAEDLGLGEGLAVTAQFRASAAHLLRESAGRG